MTIYEEEISYNGMVYDGINSLPDELIINIFEFLPLESILICENVCQRWKKLVLDPLIWRNINIAYSGKPGHREICENNLEIIVSHREYIRCLKIQYVYCYTTITSLIELCHNLINLEIVMCRIGKEFKDDILKWPKLKKLSLKNSIMPMSELEIFIKFDYFKDLSYLALSDFGLSPVNCDSLLSCHHLSHIFIEKIKCLELSFIKELILSKQYILVTLHIYGGDSIDDECLKLLAKCSSLKDLAIIRCEQLTDDGFVALQDFRKIKHLQIWNNNKFSETNLLKTLSSSSVVNLNSLSLSKIHNVTPIIVDLISECYKNLNFLALYQCPRIINTDYEKQLKSKFRNIDVVLY